MNYLKILFLKRENKRLSAIAERGRKFLLYSYSLSKRTRTFNIKKILNKILLINIKFSMTKSTD